MRFLFFLLLTGCSLDASLDGLASKIVGSPIASEISQKRIVDILDPLAGMANESAKFGSSVDISSDGLWMVVGAPEDSIDESGEKYIDKAGAAYVYEKVSGNWVLRQKIVAHDAASNDLFGLDVAIDGDTIVIGASFSDTDENSLNAEDDAGSAYVYRRISGVWELETKLTSSLHRTASDYFGCSVDIENDRIVIGAHSHSFDSSGGNQITGAGAAFVFQEVSGVWSLEQKIIATGPNARQSGDLFGGSVAISGDTIAIGASGHDYDSAGGTQRLGAGAVYVFYRSGADWVLQDKLVAFGSNGRNIADGFGEGVAVFGDDLAVGTYMHEYDSSGADPVNRAGAVFTFTRSGGIWSSDQKLVGFGLNGRAGGFFGSALAIGSADLVVGAVEDSRDASGLPRPIGSGAVYAFDSGGGSLAAVEKLVINQDAAEKMASPNARFGSDVALSEDGSTLVVGGPNSRLSSSGGDYVYQAGLVSVYVKVAGEWVLQQRISATGTNARQMNDSFGLSVAISGDTLVVGAPYQDFDADGSNEVMNAGAVYVYKRAAGSWTLEQKLAAEGSNARGADDNFGRQVAISGDVLVVGASYHDYDQIGGNFLSNAGAAFVYRRTANIWSLEQKLVGSGGANSRLADDGFGFAVAISGERIAVSSYGQDYDAVGGNYLEDAGAVYIFSRSGGVWSLEQKMIAEGLNSRESWSEFGYSVALNENVLVVGAPSHAYDASGVYGVESGAAFVYRWNGTDWIYEKKLLPEGLFAYVYGGSFGIDVDVLGDAILVGASKHPYDSLGFNYLSQAGAAFFYEYSSSDWTQTRRLAAESFSNGRNEYYKFGSSVALSAEALIVGSPDHEGTDEVGYYIKDSGAVFYFKQ